MTREEAIKILKYPVYKWSLDWDGREDGLEYSEAIQMAVAALHAQPTHLDRNRWVGCKECFQAWCKTCIRYDVRNMDTICTFSCINHSKHKPNNFCQSCGRPLTEEAWAELERRIGGL